MSLVELWALYIRIDECSDEAATVGNHELQSSGSSTLVVTGTVVGIPNQDGGHRCVHAYGHQEGHTVFDLWMCNADICNNSVTNNSGNKGEEHYDATEL